MQQAKESPDYKKIILSSITEGITHVDLTMKVMSIVNPLMFNSEEYLLTIDNLVYAKLLIKLDYSTLSNGFLDAIYFPRDTRFVFSE